jgi:hypothetical protein
LIACLPVVVAGACIAGEARRRSQEELPSYLASCLPLFIIIIIMKSSFVERDNNYSPITSSFSITLHYHPAGLPLCMA